MCNPILIRHQLTIHSWSHLFYCGF